jgi:hypothetical protein
MKTSFKIVLAIGGLSQLLNLNVASIQATVSEPGATVKVQVAQPDSFVFGEPSPVCLGAPFLTWEADGVNTYTLVTLYDTDGNLFETIKYPDPIYPNPGGPPSYQQQVFPKIVTFQGVSKETYYSIVNSKLRARCLDPATEEPIDGQQQRFRGDSRLSQPPEDEVIVTSTDPNEIYLLSVLPYPQP